MVVDYISLPLLVSDMRLTTNRVLVYPLDIQMRNWSLKYLMDLLTMTGWITQEIKNSIILKQLLSSLDLISNINNQNLSTMKKVIFTALMSLFLCTTIDAQILRTDELEDYAKEKYGEKWVDAAENLGQQLQLDKNNGITYVQIIPAEGKTKDELYVLLNYWFTATFNDANSVIKLNEKELGTIIAQGYVADIAQHAGGTNSYNVNIRPVIKCDIKDGRVRVTYTIPFYSVNVAVGGGWIGALGGTIPTRSDENWTLDTCFPFVKKDSHKKTSSKALVMAHAYSNVVMDKIEECIKNGLTGNENDNW